MVATKPHYFLDLNVQRTVENFLKYVPEFWSSQEFAASLKDGDILLIDTRFFIDMFIDLMYNEDLGEVWKVVEDFLMEESFSFLCQHLLIVLEEQDLHLFLDLIPKYIESRSEFLGFGNMSELFEIILSRYSGSINIDQLLLLNAVTTQGRYLLRLVQEEGCEEENGTLCLMMTLGKIMNQIGMMGLQQGSSPRRAENEERKGEEILILLKTMKMRCLVFLYQVTFYLCRPRLVNGCSLLMTIRQHGIVLIYLNTFHSIAF